jgi:hypothetical protein
MIPDRSGNVAGWPFDALVVILLRQFRRLLAEHDAALTDAEMQAIGDAAAARALDHPRIPAINEALRAIIDESAAVLARWNLTFAASLAATIDEMPGWESTADFLTIANEKTNAEIRISAGSALLLALGDRYGAGYLIQAVEHDLRALGELDVDATIARRALHHASAVDPVDDAGLTAVRRHFDM